MKRLGYYMCKGITARSGVLCFLAAIVFAAIAQADEPLRLKYGNSQVTMYSGKVTRGEISNVSSWASYILIFGIANFNDKCQKREPQFDIMLSSAPQHGLVCIQEIDSRKAVTQGKMWFSCDAKDSNSSLVVRQIQFQPFSNFVGKDAFEYTISVPGRKPHVVTNVNLELTPPADDDAFKNGFTAKEIQALGNIPLCPEGVT